MKKFFFDCGTRGYAASFGIFFLRVAVGSMLLFGHGLGKLQNFATIKETFPVPDFFPLTLMSHPVSLMATIFAEVVAAACIILGFMTRPAAFVIGFTMVVAAFYIHAADPYFSKTGASKEYAMLYLLPVVSLLLSGAGSYSLDALINKDSRRRR